MNKEVKNGIIISVIVILTLVIVYIATAIGTGEIKLGAKKSDYTPTETNSFDKMILANDTFSRLEDEYMVLFFSKKGISEGLKTALGYYSNDNKVLYKVNTDEAINSYVLSQEENPNATSSSDLKIKGTTLIILKNNKITEYISNEKEIVQKLSN